MRGPRIVHIYRYETDSTYCDRPADDETIMCLDPKSIDNASCGRCRSVWVRNAYDAQPPRPVREADAKIVHKVGRQGSAVCGSPGRMFAGVPKYVTCPLCKSDKSNAARLETDDDKMLFGPYMTAPKYKRWRQHQDPNRGLQMTSR